MNIYTVIHHKDRNTSRAQAELAIKNNVDGVFFISHDGLEEDVLILTKEHQEKYPNIVVGANFLSLKPDFAIRLAAAQGLSHLWIDSCGINSNELWNDILDPAVHEKKKYNGSVFVGVAFKYQPPEPDPIKAVEIALKHGFIPTTSGSKTGVEAELSKVTTMSAAANGNLALASGLTPENVKDYSPFLSHAFVSTGICFDNDFYHIDEDKLRLFIKNVGKK